MAPTPENPPCWHNQYHPREIWRDLLALLFLLHHILARRNIAFHAVSLLHQVVSVFEQLLVQCHLRIKTLLCFIERFGMPSDLWCHRNE